MAGGIADGNPNSQVAAETGWRVAGKGAFCRIEVQPRRQRCAVGQGRGGGDAAIGDADQEGARRQREFELVVAGDRDAVDPMIGQDRVGGIG